MYKLLVQISEDNCTMSKILFDNDVRLILKAAMISPKNIGQLCTECKIPASTTYRKVQKLTEGRILRKIGKINDSGKRENWYKSDPNFTKIFYQNDC